SAWLTHQFASGATSACLRRREGLPGLRAGSGDGGSASRAAARRGMSLGDLVDREPCSRQYRVAQRQQNRQCHQRIEKECELLVPYEVKRREHPHVDVRQAIGRERDIGDDCEHCSMTLPLASARYCRTPQMTALRRNAKNQV